MEACSKEHLARNQSPFLSCFPIIIWKPNKFPVIWKEPIDSYSHSLSLVSVCALYTAYLRHEDLGSDPQVYICAKNRHIEYQDGLGLWR